LISRDFWQAIGIEEITKTFDISILNLFMKQGLTLDFANFAKHLNHLQIEVFIGVDFFFFSIVDGLHFF